MQLHFDSAIPLPEIYLKIYLPKSQNTYMPMAIYRSFKKNFKIELKETNTHV